VTDYDKARKVPPIRLANAAITIYGPALDLAEAARKLRTLDIVDDDFPARMESFVQAQDAFNAALRRALEGNDG
jgi:hypothetical protein